MKKFDINAEKYQIILMLLMLVFSYFMWDHLPERVPVHWGADGTPDRYDNKTAGVLLLPIIILFTYLLLFFVRMFDKKLLDTQEGIKLFDNIRLSIMAFMVSMQVIILFSMANPEMQFITYFWASFGLFFFILGHQMSTASDDALYAISNMKEMFKREGIIRSSRVTGKAMKIIGIIVAITGYFNTIAGLVILIIGSFSLIIVVMFTAQKSN